MEYMDKRMKIAWMAMPQHYKVMNNLPGKPQLRWQMTRVTNASNVTFTSSELIVVCDNSKYGVLLFNIKGELVASSKDRGVIFDKDLTCQICYDPMDDVVVVTDWTYGLVYLSASDLSLRKRVLLAGSPLPSGIAVLSDGNLVVPCNHPEAVRVYDMQGNLLRNNQLEGCEPSQATVLIDDVITISLKAKYELHFLSKTLVSLRIINMGHPYNIYGNPRGHWSVPSAVCFVVCNSPGRSGHIIRLCGGDIKVKLQTQEYIKFTKMAHKKFGLALDIAVSASYIAVVFQRCLRLYHKPSVLVTDL